MNIAMAGDAADTGFGRVTRELAKRFIEAGHDVRLIAINWPGREGVAADAVRTGKSADEIHALLKDVEDDPVMSRAISAGIRGDGMGRNLTQPLLEGKLAKGWTPDRFLFIADPRAAIERLASDGGVCRLVKSFNYVPIEGEGLSPFWRIVWQSVEPVAMSRFGAQVLSELLGRDDIAVIPHGLSPAFYRITPEHPGATSKGEPITSKDEAKAHFGWQGRTIILRTDRNVPRKDYPAFMASIRPIVSTHPEVLVVIHCAPLDEGGLLPEQIAALPGAYDGGDGWQHSQVLLTRAHDTFKGLPEEELNLLYNAADIYASPSWAEGFGLTLLEAAACGVPVVTTGFGAGPEAVGAGAILVPPARVWPTLHAHSWSVVDVDAFSAALETLVSDPAERERLGALGEKHAAGFSWDKAALDFLRLME